MKRGSNLERGLTFEKRGDIHYLEGHIDEYADFSELLQQSEPLKLNLKGIVRLNSVGVRNLLTFIRDWGEKQIVYIECPDVVMDQLSMVKDLMGFNKKIADVESFLAPYVCESCEREEEFLVQVSDLRAKGLKLEDKKCPNCSGDMEPELSIDFFRFLTE